MIRIQPDRVTVMFGKGDIRVTSACCDDQGLLSLNTCKPNPIGYLTPTQETIESVLSGSEILMSFDNVKSLEVVILKLQQVRAMMLNIDHDDEKIENITQLYQPNTYLDGGNHECRDDASRD